VTAIKSQNVAEITKSPVVTYPSNTKEDPKWFGVFAEQNYNNPSWNENLEHPHNKFIIVVFPDC